MKRRYKISLSIVTVTLAVAAYVYFFGTQTLCVIWLKAFHKPAMDIAPEQLSINGCSDPVRRLDVFNSNFSVPWSDSVQTRVSTSSVWWACSGSNVYVFCYEIGCIAEAFRKDSEKSPKFAAALFNAEGGISNYGLFSKMFSLTPKDVSLFDSKFMACTKTTLISRKLMVIVGVKERPRLYAFKYGNIRGFQCGTPEKDGRASLYIFDRMDRPYNLVVVARTNASITQNDINTIITTFSSNP